MITFITKFSVCEACAERFAGRATPRKTHRKIEQDYEKLPLSGGLSNKVFVTAEGRFTKVVARQNPALKLWVEVDRTAYWHNSMVFDVVLSGIILYNNTLER